MIAKLFASDVGKALHASLHAGEWEPVAQPMSSTVYEIRHKRTGSLLWVANGRWALELDRAHHSFPVLSYWDRRLCWPKAKEIADGPKRDRAAAARARFMDFALPSTPTTQKEIA